MARSSKKAVVPKTTGTAIANVDDQLAKEVANFRDQVGQAAGNKIRTPPKGVFVGPDNFEFGNEIQVVVLDFISRNNFYATPYNENNIVPPDCYAMSSLASENVPNNILLMQPEEDSPRRQNSDCRTCPMNQFKSAANGRAKACQNRRLLAVLLVDEEGTHNDPNAPIYLLDLSPTNAKSFDGAANQINRMLNGPPLKAILTVTAENAGTYAAITFSDPVPNPDYAAHFARRAEAVDMLRRKPDFTAAAVAAPARGNTARRAAARR